MDLLNTSTIDNLIYTSRQSEYNRRVSPLVTKKNKFSNLSEVWDTLKTRLTTFKSVLSDLKEVNAGGSFTSKNVELSDDEYFTATADSNALLSTYNIRVDQLAKEDRVVSNTETSSDSAGLSAGTYSFQLASGENDQIVEVEVAGGETKEELMELISEAVNEAMDSAVVASVFSPVDGQSKLSIVSTDSGSANAITLQDVDGGGNILDSIGMNFTSRSLLGADGTGGYQNTTDELDSKLTFNGISVVRDSNVIDDLVSDVTINLKNAMETGIPTVNMIVKNNVEAARTDIEDFIDKFNEAYQYMKNNYYSDEDGDRGVFVGNATALNLMSSFSSMSRAQVEGIDEGDISMLSEIGISFDPSEGLSIDDEDAFDDALEATPGQVANLFNSENGIANKFYDFVDSYVKNEGVITNLIDKYDSSISYLSDKISAREDQIDANAEVLRKKYEQMQLQLAELYNTQSSLSQLGIY